VTSSSLEENGARQLTLKTPLGKRDGQHRNCREERKGTDQEVRLPRTQAGIASRATAFGNLVWKEGEVHRTVQPGREVVSIFETRGNSSKKLELARSDRPASRGGREGGLRLQHESRSFDE